MKRILLFLLLFPLSSFAQDIYNDILAEGKTWNLCRMDNGKMHVEGIRGDWEEWMKHQQKQEMEKKKIKSNQIIL